MRGSGKDAREYGKEALQRGKQGGYSATLERAGMAHFFSMRAGARVEERAFACRIHDWGPLRMQLHFSYLAILIEFNNINDIACYEEHKQVLYMILHTYIL